MELGKGQCIQRTYAGFPDSTDGFINIMQGSRFEITEVTDDFIMVRCVSSEKYPEVGSVMSIPVKYLDERYFC